MTKADGLHQRLAVDIGGTFVDAVVFDSATGEWRLEKSFSTRDNPAHGVNEAFNRLKIDGSTVGSFVHGTTLGLNTVLERRGVVTGIITNSGFEDVFEMGRYMRDRAEMYSLEYNLDPPLVPKRRRIGVPCRIDASGEELIPLDENEVLNAARILIQKWKVRSIAICYLHAYRNPVHERRTAEIIREEWPDVTVSISSDIVREYREYERTCTTVVNAYIQPIFKNYITDLDTRLKTNGFDGPFYITRSGGGALMARDAINIPVHTIFSGPAGGLIGSSLISQLLERPNIISVDIGGTSTDACVIRGGEPTLKYEAELENTRLMIPTYDISTIGAGGGSIARIETGLLKVGPQSAGANPGPICYGKGGSQPTFTDAAVVLGYINPERFLGGELILEYGAAEKGIEENIGAPLDLTALEAARGIFDVTLARTVSAIREITVEQGLDPRDFDMLAFGGAGPMFVPLVGRELNTSEIIIPQAPSVFSAWGMLMSDLVQEFAQTFVVLLKDIDIKYFKEEVLKLTNLANKCLERDGFLPPDRIIQCDASLRYFGQEHTLEVPFHDDDTLGELCERFDALHQQRYGHIMPDPVQLIHLRVRGIGKNEHPEIKKAPTRLNGKATPIGTRLAYCFAIRDKTEFRVFLRKDLKANDTIEGPSIIEEDTTTLILHSDQRLHVDDFGHLIIKGEIKV